MVHGRGREIQLEETASRVNFKSNFKEDKKLCNLINFSFKGGFLSKFSKRRLFIYSKISFEDGSR